MVALFRTPDDQETFMNRYKTEHLPLAEKMPGLLGMRHGPAQALMGDPFFYMAELFFEDRAALDASSRSQEGRDATKSLLSVTGGAVTILVTEGGERP